MRASAGCSVASERRSRPPAVSLATTVASSTSRRSRQSSSSRASEVADRSAPGDSGWRMRAQREVDRDAAVAVLERGDDVTPQVPVRERAGEEDERRTVTGRPPGQRCEPGFESLDSSVRNILTVCGFCKTNFAPRYASHLKIYQPAEHRVDRSARTSRSRRVRVGGGAIGSPHLQGQAPDRSCMGRRGRRPRARRARRRRGDQRPDRLPGVPAARRRGRPARARAAQARR